MVPTLSLLLALLAPSLEAQSERSGGVGRVAAVAPAVPVSPVDAAFEAELQEVRDLRVSYEAAQVDPALVVTERLPRFIELAQQGSGRAAAFALYHYPSLPGEFRRERTEKLDLYRTLERSFAGHDWLVERELDVFASLRRDSALLGAQRARGLARTFRRGAQSAVLKARSLLAEAYIELDAAGGDPTASRRADALLREVIELYRGSPAASEAGEALWRLENLAPGSTAPDFVATDVDGNELRLSDWNRSVVVVDFWSYDDPDAARRLETRRTLFQQFREERFALVGINLDRQETAYRRAVEELGIEWPSVFTGGPNERVIWKVRGPATFVLAPERVIQHVDVGEDELLGAVGKLIQEGKEHGDQARFGAGPPIR